MKTVFMIFISFLFVSSVVAQEVASVHTTYDASGAVVASTYTTHDASGEHVYFKDNTGCFFKTVLKDSRCLNGVYKEAVKEGACSGCDLGDAFVNLFMGGTYKLASYDELVEAGVSVCKVYESPRDRVKDIKAGSSILMR